MTDKSVRRELLEEAAGLIDGKRNEQYGEPTDDFKTTAEFWQTYLERITAQRGKLDVKAHDVAALMMLLKISRLAWKPGLKDSWSDAAGYSACGYECVQ